MPSTLDKDLTNYCAIVMLMLALLATTCSSADAAVSSKIAAGYEHTVALMDDGTVRAWGYNRWGQLGIEPPIDSNTPVVVSGLDGPVMAVAAGYGHSLALMADGTVNAWGDNSYGQLGNGTTTNSSTPVAVTGLTNVIAITAGDHNSFALMSNGTVRSWGNNSHGQLGRTSGAYNLPGEVSGLTGVKNIATGIVGNDIAAALMFDGTVKVWGERAGLYDEWSMQYLDSSTPTTRWVGGLAKDISIGSRDPVVLLADGTVNSFGVHGQPSVVNGMNGTVMAIANGGTDVGEFYCTMALMSDGTLKAWGQNGYEMFGEGTSSVFYSTPVTVTGIESVTDFTVGYRHAAALLTDGTVKEWGAITNMTIYPDGQLGNSAYYGPRVILNLDNVSPIVSADQPTGSYPGSVTVTISCNDNFSGCDSILYTDDGSDPSWPANGSTKTYSAPLTFSSTTNLKFLARDFAGNESAVQVVVYTILSAHTLSVTADGNGTIHSSGVDISCSGSCGQPYLSGSLISLYPMPSAGFKFTGWAGCDTVQGNICTVTMDSGKNVTASFGVLLSADGYIAVAAGASHTVALKYDGTVVTWGRNQHGQLGDGTTTDRTTPATVPGLTGVIAIASSAWHTVVLKNDGTVVSWGYNGTGQLGDGTTTNRLIPTPVPGLAGVSVIAVGDWHTVALKNDGTVASWGNNDKGQLGDGTTTNRHGPTPVSGLTGVTAVAAGTSHTVALKNDGTVFTWGYNSNGQLGNGTTTDQVNPILVPGAYSISAITAGDWHTVVLKSDGTVTCWGENSSGQLGDGTTIRRTSPTPVQGLSGVVSIAAGTSHTVALKNDGTIVSWGDNSHGQLGDGTNIQRNSPIEATGLMSVISLASGDDHNLVLKADGTVVTWGMNNYGQLGDGSKIDRIAPYLVIQSSSVKLTPVSQADLFFDTIGAALTNLPSGVASVLNTLQRVYMETVDLNKCNSEITIGSSYDLTFTNSFGPTVIQGELTVTCGALVPDNLLIM